MFGTRQSLRNFPSVYTPTIAGSQIPFSDNIKTLGVTLDANLALNQHVSSLCKSMHFHTRALRHIRPALSDCLATTLGTSLVQSRLDYANSLVHGTSAANVHKLQCTQNSLSRVVLSLAVIANTCQLACGFLISTGSQSVSVLISSWPYLPTRFYPHTNLLIYVHFCFLMSPREPCARPVSSCSMFQL